jgi:hypothetical protein
VNLIPEAVHEEAKGLRNYLPAQNLQGDSLTGWGAGGRVPVGDGDGGEDTDVHVHVQPRVQDAATASRTPGRVQGGRGRRSVCAFGAYLDAKPTLANIGAQRRIRAHLLAPTVSSTPFQTGEIRQKANETAHFGLKWKRTTSP